MHIYGNHIFLLFAFVLFEHIAVTHVHWVVCAHHTQIYVWFDFELIDCSHIFYCIYILKSRIVWCVMLLLLAHMSCVVKERSSFWHIRNEYKFRLDIINLHLMLWRVAGCDDHKFHNIIPHSHVSFIILQLDASAQREIIFMSTRNFTQSKRSYRKKNI